MTEGPSQYQPGDIANGHVLTGDGRWVPVDPVQQPPGPGTYPQWAAQAPPGAGQPMVYVQADNSNNTSLAPVTSLVSGLIGLLFSWIPVIGIIGWIFGPLALVFGALGLQRGKAEHKIMSWIGIVCGAITLVICLIYVVVIFGAMNDSSTS